jgi:hypothetical protein
MTGINDPFLLRVAKGKVYGHILYIIRGHKTDIDSADGFEDVWEPLATPNITYLSSAETMDIVSTSLADSDSGGVNPQSTGARTVRVEGTDSSGNYDFEDVTMDGTTAVTTTKTFLRVNFMTVLTCGTGGENAGNITATATTAGTIQDEMDAGEGLSQSSHHTVPADRTGYIYKVELNAAKLTGGTAPIVEFKGLLRSGGSSIRY